MLGKTFTPEALAAVSGMTLDELEPLLAALVRKEVLSLQADPRSPEQGQYGFLQDLVRHIAAETLSRRERRARHLAAAAHLESAFPDEGEIAEVLASHYLDAYAAAPDADDADEVKTKARETLTRAGERADALGAAGEARRYLEQAANLTDEPSERGDLLERAGWHAQYDADYDAAERLLGASIADYESVGDTRAAVRASGRLSTVEWNQGRHEEALARSERALEIASAGEADEELANLASALGLAYVFTGNNDRADELLSLALDVGESLGVHEAVARAFAGRGIIATAQGASGGGARLHEARAHDCARQRGLGARVQPLLQPLRPRVPARPLRAGARVPPRRPRDRAAPRVPPRGVVRACREHLPDVHARPLGRGSRAGRRGAGGEAERVAHHEPARLGARDPGASRQPGRGTSGSAPSSGTWNTRPTSRIAPAT